MKKIIAGSAIIASTLGSCNTSTPNTNNFNRGQNIQQTVSSKELPKEFKMKEVFFALGTDMNIISNGDKIGKVEERTFNFGKTFEYFDNTGKKRARAREEVLSLVTSIEIFDENDKFIGKVKEELFKGIFSFKSYYKITDANGNMIGESEKLSLLSTNVDIYSPSKELICKMHRPMINIATDTWSVEILKENFDKRLIIFIPCYKTSADAKRKSDD